MAIINDHWNESARLGWVLARWRARIFCRLMVFRVKHTLHGKIGLASFVVIVGILSQLAWGGFVEHLPETNAGIDGFLLLTHIWLAISATLMILSNFAKQFIKDREEEPLLAHSSQLAAFARHRVLTAIPSIVLGYTFLFYVYWWQLLSARLDHLWIAIPIHVGTIGLLAFASAIMIGWFGRMLLRRAMSNGIQNPNTLENASGTVAIIALVIMLIVIMLVERHGQGFLEALGSSIAVSIPIAMIPFAAALAADEGRWFALIGWLGLSTAFALWAARATYRWSFSAHREIPIDLATPVRRVFSSVFTGKPGRWLPPGVSAFWRKDIAVPYSREPRRYLFHQVNLLWWGIMAVILAMALRNRGNISPAFADAIPVLMTLFATAVLAMQNGINALGREGKELTWLRPILTGSQLFGRKLVVNWTYVLVHGVAYALVVFAAVSAASLNTSVWTLIAYAVGAGTIFSCLSTAVGFLLPDFERKRSSLPGSTTVGQFGYLFGALALVGITGVAHLLLTAGSIDGGFYAGMLTFALLCAAVTMSVITAAAIRQYRGMEI